MCEKCIAATGEGLEPRWGRMAEADACVQGSLWRCEKQEENDPALEEEQGPM